MPTFLTFLGCYNIKKWENILYSVVCRLTILVHLPPGNKYLAMLSYTLLCLTERDPILTLFSLYIEHCVHTTHTHTCGQHIFCCLCVRSCTYTHTHIQLTVGWLPALTRRSVCICQTEQLIEVSDIQWQQSQLHWSNSRYRPYTHTHTHTAYQQPAAQVCTLCWVHFNRWQIQWRFFSLPSESVQFDSIWVTSVHFCVI